MNELQSGFSHLLVEMVTLSAKYRKTESRGRRCKCFHLMTGDSVPTRSDGVIDPWLVSFWDKVFALYPSLADAIPMREDEP